MIFRWDFIGKGRFCLYLWTQSYCLSGRATARRFTGHGRALQFSGAALQAQTLSMAWLHRGRRRIHRLVTCVFTERTNCVFTQVITCMVTGRVACAATLGRPRAPQLPRAQAPGSRPCAATARRPWAPECRQAPVLCLACPVVRVPQWVGPTPLGWQWGVLALPWVVQVPTTPLGLRWAAVRWWAGQELSARQWAAP